MLSSDDKQQIEIDAKKKLIAALFIAENPLPIFQALYAKKVYRLAEYHNRTLLHVAAKLGDVASVEWLLKQLNIDIESVDVQGQTALHLAVEAQNAPVVETLLTHNGRGPISPENELRLLSIVNNQGQTVFHIMAQSCNKAIVDLLWKRIRYGYSDFLKIKDVNDRTAFSLAMRSIPFNEYLAAKFIFDVVVIIDDNELRELFELYQNQPHVQTFLYVAALLYDYCHVIEKILTEKPEIIINFYRHQDETAEWSVETARKRFKFDVQLFEKDYAIETGLSGMQKSKTGTAFLYAASTGNIKFAQLLLDMGFINIIATNIGSTITRNRVGATALSYAATCGQIKFAQWLVDNRHKISTNETPLLYSARAGQIKFAQWLLENGYAKPNETDSIGRTALLCAISSGQIQFAKWLIENGNAKPDEKDFSDRSAMYYAAAKDDLEFARWLLETAHAKPEISVIILLLQNKISLITINKFAELISKHLLQQKDNDLITQCLSIFERFKGFLSIEKNQNILPLFIPILLNCIINNIFSFKNEQGESLPPTEELMIEAFVKWDAYVDICKKINHIQTLVIDTRIARQYYRTQRLYDNYQALLTGMCTPEIKRDASLHLTEILMQGEVCVNNEVFPEGFASEDLPKVTAEDNADVVKEKKQKVQDILIARAIQAYEYIINYQNDEMGKRLIAQLNIMLSGSDQILRGDVAWLPQACLKFKKFYSTKMDKMGAVYETQLERTLENDQKIHTKAQAQEDEIKRLKAQLANQEKRMKDLQIENDQLKAQSETTDQSLAEKLAKEKQDETRASSPTFFGQRRS